MVSRSGKGPERAKFEFLEAPSFGGFQIVHKQRVLEKSDTLADFMIFHVHMEVDDEEKDLEASKDDDGSVL